MRGSTTWSVGGSPIAPARIEVGDGRHVDFVNTHFHHVKDAQGDKMREARTTKLLRWLEKVQPRVPAIVVGDFNSEPHIQVVKLIKEQFRSAYEVSHGKEPDSTRGGRWRPQPGESGKTLDYIFVSPDVDVLEAVFFCDQPSADDATLFPSDHVGVVATLEICIYSTLDPQEANNGDANSRLNY